MKIEIMMFVFVFGFCIGAVQAFNQMNESMTTASKGITRFKGCFGTMTNDEYVDALKRDLNERKKSKSTNS